MAVCVFQGFLFNFFCGDKSPFCEVTLCFGLWLTQPMGFITRMDVLSIVLFSCLCVMILSSESTLARSGLNSATSRMPSESVTTAKVFFSFYIHHPAISHMCRMGHNSRLGYTQSFGFLFWAHNLHNRTLLDDEDEAKTQQLISVKCAHFNLKCTKTADFHSNLLVSWELRKNL